MSNAGSTRAVSRAFIDGPQRRDAARWWLVVGGAVVVAAWLLVWRIDAGRWDPAFWQFRDDAIITLRHAHGLLDTGSVSVSASGARVSGFSAPLQFVVFLAAFRHSPSFAYDRSILEPPTDGRWYERALAALRTLVA